LSVAANGLRADRISSTEQPKLQPVVEVRSFLETPGHDEERLILLSSGGPLYTLIDGN